MELDGEFAFEGEAEGAVSEQSAPHDTAPNENNVVYPVSPVALPSGSNAICKRCRTHSITCEYKKHRRGRTKAGVSASRPHDTTPRRQGLASHSNDDDGTTTSAPLYSEVVFAVDNHQSTAARSAALDRSMSGLHTLSSVASGAREYDAPPAGSVNGNGRARSGTMASQVTAATVHGAGLPPARLALRFSHLVPVEGDSTPYLPDHTSPQATANASAQQQAELERLLRNDCPDPVSAGLLSDAEAFELFNFYFNHLHYTMPLLDPVLHSCTAVRRTSTLLFTAVLTITSKILRPKVYASCLLLANKLVGQAVENGLCSIEVVQAFHLLAYFKNAEDTTSWRRVGYAIRIALELKLNINAGRPLPTNELHAREVLNRERCWMNLIIADYHLAIHHSLPRMIQDENIIDPAQWIGDHLQVPVPGESVLAPLIYFSRLCRLYADALAEIGSNPGSLRVGEWIELEWKRWKGRWLERGHEITFPPQTATLQVCSALFRFHVAEFKLVHIVRSGDADQTLDTSQRTPLSVAFAEVVEASLNVAQVFQDDVAPKGYLPYCYHLVWVSLAITGIWLVKNIGSLQARDRARVIRSLSAVKSCTEEASRSSDDMAAFIHRLFKHLLTGISPEWQYSSLLSASERDLSTAPVMSPGSRVSGGSVGPLQSGGRQSIHDNLWSADSAILNHGSNGLDDAFGETGAMAGGNGLGASGHSQFLLGSRSGHATPGLAGLGLGGMGYNYGASGGFNGAGDGSLDDLLFPAADDEFWKNFFPVNPVG